MFSTHIGDHTSFPEHFWQHLMNRRLRIRRQLSGIVWSGWEWREDDDGLLLQVQVGDGGASGVTQHLNTIAVLQYRAPSKQRVSKTDNQVGSLNKARWSAKTLRFDVCNCILQPFFQPFDGNHRNWIFRNLEFTWKFLEFRQKILSLAKNDWC